MTTITNRVFSTATKFFCFVIYSKISRLFFLLYIIYNNNNTHNNNYNVIVKVHRDGRFTPKQIECLSRVKTTTITITITIITTKVRSESLSSVAWDCEGGNNNNNNNKNNKNNKYNHNNNNCCCYFKEI